MVEMTLEEDLLAIAKIPYKLASSTQEILVNVLRKHGREDLHYCPEWDGLLIDKNDPEFGVCTCFTKREE